MDGPRARRWESAVPCSLLLAAAVAGSALILSAPAGVGPRHDPLDDPDHQARCRMCRPEYAAFRPAPPRPAWMVPSAARPRPG